MNLEENCNPSGHTCHATVILFLQCGQQRARTESMSFTSNYDPLFLVEHTSRPETGLRCNEVVGLYGKGSVELESVR